jgi:hypothetical protein
LAAASLAGIDPEQFLEADELKVQLLTLVANRAIELDQVKQKNQAAYIINYLGKAFGSEKKSRGSS